MQDTAICPYYGNNEDACDVGCGYISSHDANMIIKFCSCQHQACHKYKELSDRFDSTNVPQQPAAPPLHGAPSGKASHLPVLGLFSYGITVAFYALDKLPSLSIDLHLMAGVIMLGASGLISSGLNALKENLLRAISFTGLGLFWLSILALDILPRAGYGTIPGQIPMTGYFAMWGLFSLIICQDVDMLTRISRLVFAMMTGFLLLLSMANATDNTTVLYAAVIVGLASGLPGIILCCRTLWNDTLHLFQSEVAKSGRLR
jgi:succinate-acetate transporter protein